MSEFDKGVCAGVLITVVTIALVALFYGCGVVEGESSVVSMGKVGVSEVPDRPLLPEGWVVVGDMYVNELTRDTIR